MCDKGCMVLATLFLLALAQFPAVALDEPLAVVRRRPDGLSHARPLDKWKSWLRVWERHRERMLEAGCRPGMIRSKIAHAHKKIAQTLHARKRKKDARSHYLAWWRHDRLALRGLVWWAALATASDADPVPGIDEH